LQFRGAQLDQGDFNRVPNLPLHIHRDADAARARQRLDARGDVHAVPVNIPAAMHHVADVNADLDLDAPVATHVMIALGQRALDFDAALRGFQGTVELDEEGVADGFNLSAIE